MRRLLPVFLVPFLAAALSASADAAERCFPPGSGALDKALVAFWPHGVRVVRDCDGKCTAVTFRGATLLSTHRTVGEVCLDALPADDRQKDRRCHSVVYGSELSLDRPRTSTDTVAFAYVKTLADIDACRASAGGKPAPAAHDRRSFVLHNVEVTIGAPPRTASSSVASP